MKETELFPLVKAYLERLGYEVFAEVNFKGTGRYFDVIGLDFLNERSISVEMKTSYNDAVKKQASFNSNYFDQTFVAIPKPKKNLSSVLAHPMWGILWIDLDNSLVTEVVTPSKSRTFMMSFENLLKRLYINEINKEIEGGMQLTLEGMTASSITLRKVVEFLKSHGPADLKTIISNVSTHWKSPAGNLRFAIQEAKNLPIGVDRTSIPHKFYYIENT